ncbi:MAG: elongation factor G [Planctomycetota bacterium]
MASTRPATTRNVAVCGQAACGKTTLVESLLFVSGAIERKGSVEAGTTVSDGDAQEKARKHSIDLSTVHLEAKGLHFNWIDTPGYRDFVGQVYSALPVVENFVLVVDADEGVGPHSRKLWQLAEEAGLPRFVVVNRLDREHAKLEAVLDEIAEQLSPKCLPLDYPVGVGVSLSGVEWLAGGTPSSEEARRAATRLVEAIVEGDDALMERYLGGEPIGEDELDAQLRRAVASRQVFPVLFSSGEKDIGVAEVLDALVRLSVPATESLGRTLYPRGKPEEAFELPTSPDAPFCGYVFKVLSDPYVGKLSYLRVFSGSIGQNGAIVNPRTGKQEKIGKIVRLQGREQEPVDVAVAGDIVALAKVEGLKAFDVVAADRQLERTPPKLPTPMYSRAVQPKSKADEKKFAEAFAKVVDEDVMVRAERDRRTGDMVVSGTSQLHLTVLWERLKSRFGVEVSTREPKTPYLETITTKGDDHYRHKKQTGGAGEFAEVWLRVSPLERGQGVQFVNSVFGGAISANYVASAEKGIRAVMEKGVIAGYPVVDVLVDVYDGKEHPVDSKDIAFQKAGREAFRLAMKQAKPVLLEPIVNLEVTFQTECMGEIQGDLNRRRARVIGAESSGSFQTLKAQVPLAELSDYATTLGSITGGQGSYSIEPSHYEIVPPAIQQRICEAAKAELAKEKEED